MGENSKLAVDRLSTPESLQSTQGIQTTEESSSSSTLLASGSFPTTDGKEDEDMGGEDEPLIQSVECRICQEEDSIKNLEIPCACNGSLKFAHRECVQRWCNEKGDITCEICHQPYQPNYTAPPPAHPNDTAIDISDDWTLAGGPYDPRDPRLLVMAEAERRLLEADYDEYNDSGANGAAFCRSAALILMALLLLRHALTIGNGDEDDDDVSTFFSLFLLRVAGFLLPCYIMAWAISILQRRRQREEATTRAAADVAFLLQAGQHRGIQVRIAQVARQGNGSATTGVPVPPATEEHVVNVPVS